MAGNVRPFAPPVRRHRHGLAICRAATACFNQQSKMIEELVRQYGYVAVALGAFAEGETVLLVAGYAAQRGWLQWPLVAAIAAIAATMGDQMFFFLGRRFGPQLLARFPRLRARLPRVQTLLDRGGPWAIVSVRFLYGLRIAGPVLIGVAGIAPWRFVIFNAIGAMLWAPMITGLGWFFGTAMVQLAARLQLAEELLLAGVAVVVLLVWMVRQCKRLKACRLSIRSGRAIRQRRPR